MHEKMKTITLWNGDREIIVNAGSKMERRCRDLGFVEDGEKTKGVQKVGDAQSVANVNPFENTEGTSEDNDENIVDEADQDFDSMSKRDLQQTYYDLTGEKLDGRLGKSQMIDAIQKAEKNEELSSLNK